MLVGDDLNLKKNNQRPNELSINEFIHLQNIFSQKGWPIEDLFSENIFQNFCELFANLNIEERKLMFELTEQFLWVNESKYMSFFSKALDNFILKFEFKDRKNIFLCPVLPIEDFGKSKSSIILLYLIKAHLRAIQEHFSEFNISFFDSPELIDFKKFIDGDNILCLIDDFIGTGNTVEKSIDFLLKNGITKDMISVLSLVGMKSGIEKLANSGYSTYVCTTVEKGLSLTGDETKIATMQNIEKRIKVDEDYKFGYGGSESLVRMIRTPNNTFPIYWLKTKKNKYAPFPR